MKVDLVYSLPHYFDHALPVWEHLPEELKGDVHPLRDTVMPPARGRAALVAGWQDVQPLRGITPMIYIEHGAGQTYAGDMKTAALPGYSASGGARHHGVMGFIAPNRTVAARWKSAPAVAVGCPKLDKYVGWGKPERPAVCFAWHWDCVLSPETRSAWPHYEAGMAAVVAEFKTQGFDVYGHAHPRWGGLLDKRMAATGMTILESDDEVFLFASVLFVDNSSIGAEFMTLGRPVGWMNAPWYRRDVHHGGRFWDWTAGLTTVDGVADLININLTDMVNNQDEAAARELIVPTIYEYTDGSSSQRAADFVAQLVS